jgi:hypothetical protein
MTDERVCGVAREYCELRVRSNITWVILKVLHTVCFLFKNEFILQNTCTGLQCNLHCALSQRSNVWESLVFLFVDSFVVDVSDYSGHLI